METNINDTKKYGHLWPTRVYLAISLGISVVGAILLIFAVTSGTASTLVSFLVGLCGEFMMAAFIYTFASQWNNSLTFSPEGIIFHNGLYRIYSPWENITAIARTHVLRSSVVFVLREPAQTTTSFSDDVQLNRAVIERRSFLLFQRDLRRYASTIPFLGFVSQKEWKDGQAKLYIQRHAPQLLEP